MATTYNVRYKNHCTPQEQIVSGGRYYLDSDCGRKLTGVADTSATLSATGTLASGTSISDTATEVVSAASNADFVFIKNTGSTNVLITLDNSNYLILLSEGEAFASEINSSAVVKAKPVSSASILEYYGST